VAATGDHNTRLFFAYPDPREALLRYGVPLLLHLPPAYLEGRRFDPERLAGPRDLFPTLAGLALPGERLLATGRDLLLPSERPRALTGFEVVIGDAGAAIGLMRPLFFRRDDQGALQPCSADDCRAPLERLVAEERAYVALLDWNIRRQALRR
jgi:hypothetical protein